MEIILKEDVINLGYKNDIVTVKSGYGRNYLIPTGKAVIASPSAKKMLAEELKQRAHKLEKIKKDAEELAAKLEGVTLKIATKVSSTGTIFGSVGNIQIADELAKLGHNIDRKLIFTGRHISTAIYVTFHSVTLQKCLCREFFTVASDGINQKPGIVVKSQSHRHAVRTGFGRIIQRMLTIPY